MSSFSVPSDYSRIRVVASFDELVASPFDAGVNALCWPRALPGNFGEIVTLLAAGEGITTLDEEQLLSLPLGAEGKVALAFLLDDLHRLRAQDRDPVLNCIDGYPRDEDPGAVVTDVMSFHVDRAPVEADTWLCTYHGACSEGLRNDEALRRVDIPETRAALLKEYGGEDDEGFVDYLSACCYDLHFAAVPTARPFSFGLGNLWRIAVDWPGSAVPACVHRAPDTLPGDVPRLMMIS